MQFINFSSFLFTILSVLALASAVTRSPWEVHLGRTSDPAQPHVEFPLLLDNFTYPMATLLNMN